MHHILKHRVYTQPLPHTPLAELSPPRRVQTVPLQLLPPSLPSSMQVLPPSLAQGSDHRQMQQQQQQQQAPPVAAGTQQERIAYATRMRQLFSPPGMLHEDGSIDQEFFRPKTVVTLADRKWGDAEREQLYRGLEKHGVGRWRQMADDMLRGWDDNNIRLKAARLLGCQNLSRYHGRRFSRAEVEAELAANKQLGARTGCWKNGMLVDDDSGTLAAHFREQAQQQQQQQQGGP